MSTRLAAVLAAVAVGMLGPAAVVAIVSAPAGGSDGPLSTAPTMPLSYCGYTDQVHCDY